MSLDTKVLVKPTLADFLYNRYSTARDQERRDNRRNLSQNKYAEDIGMIPQTFSRYINGDTAMTLDQAVILLKFFGTDIVDHFDYGPGSSLDRDTASIIALMPRLNDGQRKLVVNFLERSTQGENFSNLEDLLSGA